MKNAYLSGEITDLEEGIYKPDTYFFKLGFPRSKLLNQMKTAQEKFLNSVWKSKPKNFVLKNKNELFVGSLINTYDAFEKHCEIGI